LSGYPASLKEAAAMMDAALNVEFGKKHPRRLEVFLDVVYALLFIRMIDFLPPAEHMRWVDSPIGILQVFADNPGKLLRIVIPFGVIWVVKRMR
jgi:hypothetical protein